jgi:hypothetical protein
MTQENLVSCRSARRKFRAAVKQGLYETSDFQFRIMFCSPTLGSTALANSFRLAFNREP